MAWAPNLLISVPLGISAPLPSAPPPPRLPSGLAPPARAGGGLRRWKALRTPSSPPPPSPGQTRSSFHSSPPLPPPRLPSSKSFHPRQLQEEADALLRGRGNSGSGGGWSGGTGGCDPGGRLDRARRLDCALPFAPALRLPGSTSPARESPAAAGVHSRSEAAPRGWPLPQPCPSFPPSLAAPPRRSSDSPPESS